MLQGLVIGATAQSTALTILDSSSGFDLAAVYSLARSQTSPDAAVAEQLVTLPYLTLPCDRASPPDLVPATLYVSRDMAAPQPVLKQLAAVLASAPGKPT